MPKLPSSRPYARFGELQHVHVETRVKFVVHDSSVMLCGEGWIQPRETAQSKDVTCILIDRPTLFEATEHGVLTEKLNAVDVMFWLNNHLIYEHDGRLFVMLLEDEYEVLA